MQTAEKVVSGILPQEFRVHKGKHTNQKDIFPTVEFTDGTSFKFPAYALFGIGVGSRVIVVYDSQNNPQSIEELL